MAGQPGLFDRDERYAALSAAGDPLERLAAVVDFELFRPDLEAALDRSDRARGGRPPYDAVLMFKVLVLQTLYTLSDDQTEYQIRDRLSFMRFLDLALEDRVPDAKTIWLFREQLTKAGAIERLFTRFRRGAARRRVPGDGRADRGCHRTWFAATPAGRGCESPSSMSSPPRNVGSVWSSARSASPVRPPS
jgi:transposase, IS5 family